MPVWTNSHSSQLHLFTATVVFTIFLLSVYIALVTSLNYHRERVLVSSVGNSKVSRFASRDFIGSVPRVLLDSEGAQVIVKHPGISPIQVPPASECKDKNCLDNLSSNDMKRLDDCTNRVKELVSTMTGNQSMKGDCRFISQKGHAPTALVSYPGSGNTWVRGLIERVTGICTGAVYCDVSLRANGFIGENICSGTVLAVKTHEVRPMWMKNSQSSAMNCTTYGAVVLIVRNPFHALVAEWNRKVANNFRKITVNLDTHTAVADKEWFGDNIMWNAYIKAQIMKWKAIIKNWFLFNRNVPVTVVTYEALKNSTASELRRIFHFMKVYNMQQRIESVMEQGFTMFKRRSRSSFKHFTCKQQEEIHLVMKDVESLLVKHKKSQQLNLSSYYRTLSDCLK